MVTILSLPATVDVIMIVMGLLSTFAFPVLMVWLLTNFDRPRLLTNFHRPRILANRLDILQAAFWDLRIRTARIRADGIRGCRSLSWIHRPYFVFFLTTLSVRNLLGAVWDGTLGWIAHKIGRAVDKLLRPS